MCEGGGGATVTGGAEDGVCVCVYVCVRVCVAVAAGATLDLKICVYISVIYQNVCV